MVKLSLVVLSSLAAAVSAATEVVHLTKDTFKDFVAKEPLTLVGMVSVVVDDVYGTV